MQNNIVYNNNGFAIPTIDNNGRIIENNNFFFDETYLYYQYNTIIYDVENICANNNISQQTIDMIHYCMSVFRLIGCSIGRVVDNLIEFYNYTDQNLRNRNVNISTLQSIVQGQVLNNGLNVQHITFEQLVNYLCNKIHYIGIQCVYNIQHIVENANVAQRANMIRQAISNCHEEIMSIVNLFQNSLLHELSLGTYTFYHRDLAQDINNELAFSINRMSQIKNQYNL